jgi:hypothetical protein
MKYGMQSNNKSNKIAIEEIGLKDRLKRLKSGH